MNRLLAQTSSLVHLHCPLVKEVLRVAPIARKSWRMVRDAAGGACRFAGALDRCPRPGRGPRARLLSSPREQNGGLVP